MSVEKASDDPRYRLVKGFLTLRSTGTAPSIDVYLDGLPGEPPPELRGLLLIASEWAEDDVDFNLDTLFGTKQDATVAITRPEAGHDEKEIFDRRYRIVRTLGQGGAGKVYLVEDTLQNDELLALKVVLEKHTAQPEFELRFRNEIRVLRALSHPGIPQIFNDGKSPDGEIYYTMSFVKGITLDDLIERSAPLQPARIVNIIRQVLEVLHYAHGKGVVHRDLKPANIVLANPGTPEERVLVLDFGIAKILAREGLLEQALTMQTQVMIGTPHYMSPEQVRGQDVDAATDIYALGVIIYQMCSGKLPFTGKTLMELLTSRLETPAPKLDKEDVPDWLKRLVNKLLAQDRAKRPTCSQIQSQIGPTSGATRPPKNTTLRNVSLTVAALGVAAAGIFFWPRSPEPTAVVATNRPPLTAAGPDQVVAVGDFVRLVGNVSDPEGQTLSLNWTQTSGPSVELSNATLARAGFEATSALADATLVFQLKASDGVDSATDSVTIEVGPLAAEATPRPVPVLRGLQLLEPPAGKRTKASSIRIAGKAEPAADFAFSIGVEGMAARSLQSASDGSFQTSLALPERDGTCVIVATSADGATELIRRELTIDRTPPRFGRVQLVGGEPARIESSGPARLTLSFQFEPAEFVRIKSATTSTEVSLPNGRGNWELPIPNADAITDEADVLYRFEVSDELGNSLVKTFSWRARRGGLGAPVEDDDANALRDAAGAGASPALVDPAPVPIEKAPTIRGSAPIAAPVAVIQPDGQVTVTLPDGSTQLFGLPSASDWKIELSGGYAAVLTNIASGDRAEMVLVLERLLPPDQRNPERMTEVAPFWMDRYEVTFERYEQYVAAVTASGAAAPSYEDHDYAPSQSVLAVAHGDAEAFATWGGRALPTTLEWEAAGGWTGSELLAYSFGNEFDPDKVVVRNNKDGLVTRDELRSDVSPAGIYSMGIGATEWCVETEGSKGMARGGFSDHPIDGSFRQAYSANESVYDKKFRLDLGRSFPLNGSAYALRRVGIRCVLRLEERE